MVTSRLKKIKQDVNWLRFHVGELFFPVLEPLFRIRENMDPVVRRHFNNSQQALKDKNIPVALLNLNMVLSLNPNHFVARVYRGRIHIQERQFRQASEDYIQACKISRYRFVHYDLYREYFSALNKGIGHLGASIFQNFNRAFEALRKAQETLHGKTEKEKEANLLEEAPMDPEDSQEHQSGQKNPMFTREEQLKFQALAPITYKEIRETDWDDLIKDLTSPEH